MSEISQCVEFDECVILDDVSKLPDNTFRPIEEVCIPTSLVTACMQLPEVRLFMPEMITAFHAPQAVMTYAAKHIKAWSGVSRLLNFDVIWDLPPVEFEVHEFQPQTSEMQRQFQYIRVDETAEWAREEKVSPLLALAQIESSQFQKCNQYLATIVGQNQYMERVAGVFYDYQEQDFPTCLLQIVVRFTTEVSLTRNVLHLLVCVHCICRTATINSSTTPSRTSPRMANRQIKYLFFTLYQNIFGDVLKELQRMLLSSDVQGWMSQFTAVLGVAMASERLQRMVYVFMDTHVAMKECSERDAEVAANSACRKIDEAFGVVSDWFWKKYQSFNPLMDVKEAGDESPAVAWEGDYQFVREIVSLIESHKEFLHERQNVRICKENHHKYTSRLVAKFLLSFSRGEEERLHDKSRVDRKESIGSP